MNIVEKILARASGKDRVYPDDVIFAKVDKAMVHDVSGPGVIKVFDKLKKQGITVDKLWDPSRVWVAEDHFVPSAEKISAENIVKLPGISPCSPATILTGLAEANKVSSFLETPL